MASHKALITELLKFSVLVFEDDETHVSSQVTVYDLLYIHVLIYIIYKYVYLYAHLILVITVHLIRFLKTLSHQILKNCFSPGEKMDHQLTVLAALANGYFHQPILFWFLLKDTLVHIIDPLASNSLSTVCELIQAKIFQHLAKHI